MTVEGEFFIPEKESFVPTERQAPVKPHDNLTVGGTFEGRRSDDYRYQQTSKSEIIRHEDNIKVSQGTFYSQTTSQKDYQREVIEDEPLRRNTYTKEESELEETKIRRRTWTKEELEEIRMKVQEDNKPKYKPIDRPTQVKPTDNLKPEGEFYTPDRDQFRPSERPVQVKPSDNLRPEGVFDRPDKNEYRPAEKVTQKKPQDNLRPEGDMYVPEKNQFTPSERPKQVISFTFHFYR